MQGFNVTRELAARLIGKSLRTIDRYLKSGKVRFIKVDGRTWLSREDVLNLSKSPSSYTDNDEQKDSSRHSDSINLNDVALDFNKNQIQEIEAQKSELIQRLEKNQNLLNLALKKIKSLKLELSNSVSTVEYNAKINLLKEGQVKYVNYIKKMDFHYKTQQKKYIQEIVEINTKLDSEKLNKMIIAFILGLILVVQPFIFMFLK